MKSILDDSIDQYRVVASRLGRAEPRARRETSDEWKTGLANLRERIAPLTLPDELVEFWERWEPGSFELLGESLITFYEPTQALEGYEETVGLQYPRILLPVLSEASHSHVFAIELCSPNHPGSRTFAIDFHLGTTRMIGVGIADPLDLFRCAIESTEAMQEQSPYPGPIDVDRYSHLLQLAFGEIGHLQVEDLVLATWPQHWRDVEGYTVDWLQPRGATHTVAEFDTLRESDGEFSGVLHGQYRTSVAGGLLFGAVGQLRDSTGSIQVFIPDGCRSGGSGPDGWCEMEVEAVRKGGTPSSALPRSSDDLADATSVDEQARVAFVQRMLDATKELDISVRVKAIRPIPHLR